MIIHLKRFALILMICSGAIGTGANIAFASGEEPSVSEPTLSMLTKSAYEDFSDISESPYAEAINYLYRKGIIEGYEDGTFRSSNNINRAEFLKMLMESYNIQKGGESCYEIYKRSNVRKT